MSVAAREKRMAASTPPTVSGNQMIAWSHSGGRTAFVLAADGLAERRDIRLGARSAGEVEVLGGLSEGERVIISSIAEYQEYDTIQVID